MRIGEPYNQKLR